MARALELARAGLGRVAPNPSVGCVLVKDGEVIAEARTSDGGHPHAEAAALEKAGEKAKACVAYVTLEPCFKEAGVCCSNLLIKFGVSKVIVGCLDENPAIRGKGVAALERAGISVEVGCLEEECRELNKGFFLSKTNARPLVTLKIALSLDGKIATRTGHSQWITGEEARRRVHEMRSTHDAILTGIGTVLADDPQLTARIEGVNHTIRRCVLDTDGRMPVSARMLSDKAGPVTVFSGRNGGNLPDVEVVTTPVCLNGTLDLNFVLAHLAEKGVTRLMVEAGQGVFTSFLKSGLWDHLYIMRASVIVGADGVDAFGGLDTDTLDAALRPVLVSREALGPDLLEIYAPPVSA